MSGRPWSGSPRAAVAFAVARNTTRLVLAVEMINTKSFSVLSVGCILMKYAYVTLVLASDRRVYVRVAAVIPGRFMGNTRTRLFTAYSLVYNTLPSRVVATPIG